MSDRREEILSISVVSGKIGNGDVCCDLREVKNAMDDYMTECCLEMLEYMAKHDVRCYIAKNGISYFQYKGEFLTKEQLFENFI